MRPPPRMWSIARRATLAALALCVVPFTSEAREAPTNSTVLIRVRGTVRIEAAAFPGASPEVVELRDVEIGTGSGFVVSQDGYVVTNHHCVADDAFVTERQGQRARVSLKVERIEVVFPRESDLAAGQPRRYSASLVASDPTLDLAFLYVSVPGLSVAALGDSDVVTAGDSVQALGYPLGDLLEIARTGSDDVAPAVTSSPGAISALRTDDRGELAYLQTTATLNPGNSGGPIVDQDGYVVGVVRMQVRGASGIGFAIPINRVKRFLGAHGVDHQLPERSRDLGAPYAPPGKGLSLRVPDGFHDDSSTRLRVEAGIDRVALRIDRIASTWRADQIERVLLSGEVFEPQSWTQKPRTAKQKSPRLTVGAATGVTAGRGEELAMEYALLTAGRERLVARYVGPADAIAFNRATLRASLASLDGGPLVTLDFDGKQEVAWVPSSAARLSLPLPAGWIVESGGAPQCEGLPMVDSALTAAPPSDFTVTFRAAQLAEVSLDAVGAAARCSTQRASFGAASYVANSDWLGTAYTIEGAFVQTGGGLLHLQYVSPLSKAAGARDLFIIWLRQVTQSSGRP